MTKFEELRILVQTVKSLGKDSYCGPWLEEQLPYIQFAMGSDENPSTRALSLKEAETHVRNLLEDARKQDTERLEKAEAEASRIIRDAQNIVAEIHARAASALRAALQTINGQPI